MPPIGFTPDEGEMATAWAATLTQKTAARHLALVRVRVGEAEQNLAQVNSLCTFLQNRAASAPLCARDCGAVMPLAALAVAPGQPHRCHAGLQIVRVEAGPGQAFIGGRALVTQRDYQALTERLRRGDLRGANSAAIFRNLIWATLPELSDLGANLLREVAQHKPTQISEANRNDATEPQDVTPALAWEAVSVAETWPSDDDRTEAEEQTDLTQRADAAENRNTPDRAACGVRESLADNFGTACVAALRVLAGACGLQQASLWWRQDGGFVKACGLGEWAADAGALHCEMSEAQLLAAAETHTGLPAQRTGDAWQIVAAPATLAEAELFPFLAGTEIKAAFLLARSELDDATRRAVARYGLELALPLEVLRLQQEMAQHAQAAQQTVHFAEALQSAGAADGYTVLLRQTAQLLHAQRASLMVYEETEGRLEIKAGLGLPDGVAQQARVRAGEGVAGHVWHTGRPWLAGADTDATDTPPVVAATRAYRSPSFLSYPINVGGQRIGVLNVTDRADGSPYNEADVRLLDTIAPQLGLALDRAGWRERALLFQRMSITDPLTGLANRRYLTARLAEEVSRAERHHAPICFIMMDLDNFKNYNDNNGHQAGDEALVLLAQCLRSTLRAVDIAARYGGEEFSILLPQTTLREGSAIAERIRQLIAATPFPHGAQQPNGQVSVSLGVADYAPGRTTPAAIIKAADQALYQAKNAGRNRVQVFEL